MGIECDICKELLETEPSTSTSPSLPDPAAAAVASTSSVSAATSNDIVAMTTPCGHIFHHFCIRKWIDEQRPTSCPVCRKLISEKKLIRIYPTMTKDVPIPNNPTTDENDDDDGRRNVYLAQAQAQADAIMTKATAELRILRTELVQKDRTVEGLTRLLDQKKEEVANSERVGAYQNSELDRLHANCEHEREHNRQLSELQISLVLSHQDEKMELQNKVAGFVCRVAMLEAQQRETNGEIQKLRGDNQQLAADVERLRVHNCELQLAGHLRKEEHSADMEAVEKKYERDQKCASKILEAQRAEIDELTERCQRSLLTKIVDGTKAKLGKFTTFRKSRKMFLASEVEKGGPLKALMPKLEEEEQESKEGQGMAIVAVAVQKTQKRKGDELDEDSVGAAKKKRVDDDYEFETTEDEDEMEEIVENVIVTVTVSPKPEPKPATEAVAVAEIQTDNIYSKAFGEIKIMSNLAKYLPTRKLPQLRLTCQSWNSAIIPELRCRHFELKFSRSKDSLGIKIEDCDREKALQDFVDTMSNSPSIPFGKYHVGSIAASENCIANLLTTCGPHITDLKITLQEQNGITLSYLNSIIFGLAPTLRVLEIVDQTDSADEFWKQELPTASNQRELPILTRFTLMPAVYSIGQRVVFRNFLIHLFRSAKNLCHIEIKQNPTAAQNVHENSDALKAVEEAANLAKLKTLIVHELPKPSLDILVKMGSKKKFNLRLESFATSYVARSALDVPGMKQLNKFLKTQATSLKRFFVGMVDDRKEGLILSSVTMVLPKMPALTELTWCVDQFYTMKLSVRLEQSLHADFPNLNTFALLHKGSNMRQFEWKKIVCPGNGHAGVKVLHVDNIGRADDLSELAKTFPNVRKLKVEVNFLNPVSGMWSKWTGLESCHVAIFGSSDDEGALMDEYITGIPTKEHEALKLKMADGVSMADLNLVKANPGIADSKHLRELTLEFAYDDPDSPSKNCVTDISGYYGFCLAESLRILNVLPGNGIMPTCRESIRQSMGPQATARFGSNIH